MPNGTKRYTLVIPDDLHVRCVEAAKADHRSLNSWILRAIERHLPIQLESVEVLNNRKKVILEAEHARNEARVVGHLESITYPAREEKLHS